MYIASVLEHTVQNMSSLTKPVPGDAVTDSRIIQQVGSFIKFPYYFRRRSKAFDKNSYMVHLITKHKPHLRTSRISRNVKFFTNLYIHKKNEKSL
jgi:hypothetical protein